jgi:hypothetical protein
MLHPVAKLEVLFCATNAGGELAKQLWSNDSCLNRMGFKYLPKLVEIMNLLLGEPTNMGTPP